MNQKLIEFFDQAFFVRFHSISYLHLQWREKKIFFIRQCVITVDVKKKIELLWMMMCLNVMLKITMKTTEELARDERVKKKDERRKGKRKDYFCAHQHPFGVFFLLLSFVSDNDKLPAPIGNCCADVCSSLFRPWRKMSEL